MLNGKIEEPTLERMGEIRGKPVRRGLDKAINECLDLLENKVENGSFDMTVCDDCKEELKN